MKPYLLYEHDSLSPESTPATGKHPFESELVQDLNLHDIFGAMSGGSRFIYETAKKVMLDSLVDVQAIIYRQNILKDCLNNESFVKELFSTASSAVKEAAYFKEYTQTSFSKIIPVSVRLYNSVGLLELLVKKLEKLRLLIGSTADSFESKGMKAFCERFDEMLTEEFFSKVRFYIEDLKALGENGNIVIGSSIGNGLKGDCHVLRGIMRTDSGKNTRKQLQKTTAYNIIPLENYNIINSAKEIEDAALIHILRAINQFTGSILHFFEALQFEAGFYTGCVNLYNVLERTGAPISFPSPMDYGKAALTFEHLYDAAMAVESRESPVANNLQAPGKTLFIITGANQGGKSTFLRSIGLAQLMMQCGAFVPAAAYHSNVCDNIFTHFTREEDARMNSGKLDEELSRMNDIIGRITPHSMLLMNEPFATTTERDGSRIASDIVSALHEAGVKILFVTHLYDFASQFYSLELERAMFLRAARNDDGSRSYVIKEGKPLQTSFGEDLLKEIAGSLINVEGSMQAINIENSLQVVEEAAYAGI